MFVDDRRSACSSLRSFGLCLHWCLDVVDDRRSACSSLRSFVYNGVCLSSVRSFVYTGVCLHLWRTRAPSCSRRPLMSVTAWQSFHALRLWGSTLVSGISQPCSVNMFSIRNLDFLHTFVEQTSEAVHHFTVHWSPNNELLFDKDIAREILNLLNDACKVPPPSCACF